MPPPSLPEAELQAIRNKVQAQIEHLWAAVWQHQAVHFSEQDLERLHVKWLPFTLSVDENNKNNNNDTGIINNLNPDFEPRFFGSWTLEKLHSHPIDMDKLDAYGDEFRNNLAYPVFDDPKSVLWYTDNLFADVSRAEEIARYVDWHFYHVPRVGVMIGLGQDDKSEWQLVS